MAAACTSAATDAPPPPRPRATPSRCRYRPPPTGHRRPSWPTVWSKGPRRGPHNTLESPRSARATAVARPTPLPAPVTTAQDAQPSPSVPPPLILDTPVHKLPPQDPPQKEPDAVARPADPKATSEARSPRSPTTCSNTAWPTSACGPWPRARHQHPHAALRLLQQRGPGHGRARRGPPPGGRPARRPHLERPGFRHQTSSHHLGLAGLPSAHRSSDSSSRSTSDAMNHPDAYTAAWTGDGHRVARSVRCRTGRPGPDTSSPCSATLVIAVLRGLTPRPARHRRRHAHRPGPRTFHRARGPGAHAMSQRLRHQVGVNELLQRPGLVTPLAATRHRS